MRSEIEIAFLGYDRNQTRLIGFLERSGYKVSSIAGKVDNLSSYDLVISFGYRYILRQSVLDTARRPVLNLHISYLPYNRGAHPNFWSWIEGTPCGVTIHEIDRGIDTGPIVAQAQLKNVSEDMTFRKAHSLLVRLVEQLFEDSAAVILNGQYKATSQVGRGTYHTSKDLPCWMKNWDVRIIDAIVEYKRRG